MPRIDRPTEGRDVSAEEYLAGLPGRPSEPDPWHQRRTRGDDPPPLTPQDVATRILILAARHRRLTTGAALAIGIVVYAVHSLGFAAHAISIAITAIVLSALGYTAWQLYTGRLGRGAGLKRIGAGTVLLFFLVAASYVNIRKPTSPNLPPTETPMPMAAHRGVYTDPATGMQVRLGWLRWTAIEGPPDQAYDSYMVFQVVLHNGGDRPRQFSGGDFSGEGASWTGGADLSCKGVGARLGEGTLAPGATIVGYAAVPDQNATNGPPDNPDKLDVLWDDGGRAGGWVDLGTYDVQTEVPESVDCHIVS